MKKSYTKAAIKASLFIGCGLAAANVSAMLLNQDLFVTIPVFESEYQISASALLLQPTSSSLDYGIHTRPLPILNPNWVIQTINPDYSIGFDVGLGYIFSKSANDVQLMWAHLEQNKWNADSDISPNFIGPFYEIGPDTGSIHNVEGNSKFRYNLINLDVGQFVNFGCRMQARFFTGVSSVFLTQHLSSMFSADSNDPAFSMRTDNISKYEGVGPRFGLATTYHFCPNFNLVAEIAGSAYIGRMRASLESIGTAGGVPPNPQSINSNNVNRLVPGADGKLGLNYYFDFNKCSSFKLEGGYQFATYFNAIRQIYPSTLAAVGGVFTPIQTGSIFVGTMGQSQSNFSVAGPYLNGVVSF